jgi:hypothetical protein
MAELKRIGWEDGTLISNAKVEVNGTIYEVTPEQYSGSTPLSAENLKQMETNTENAIKETANEIKTEISQKKGMVKLALSRSKEFTAIAVDDLSKYSAFVLQVTDEYNYRVLATTLGTYEQFSQTNNSRDWETCFGGSPSNYTARAYYGDSQTVYMSVSSDIASGVLYGILK